MRQLPRLDFHRQVLATVAIQVVKVQVVEGVQLVPEWVERKFNRFWCRTGRFNNSGGEGVGSGGNSNTGAVLSSTVGSDTSS